MSEPLKHTCGVNSYSREPWQMCAACQANDLQSQPGSRAAASLNKAVPATAPNGADSGTVPLSAIRALVQQWREEVVGDNSTVESASYFCGAQSARDACADQLAALCPAPPEDQT